MDAKGRVTGATTLVAGDLPAHTHVATDIVSGSLPFTIQKAGTPIGSRRALNLIEGSNVTLTVADDAGNDRVNVTVAAVGGTTTHNLLSATHPDTAADSPVLGDLVAANITPVWARLAGQTTTTRKFLRQTGTGSVSALPAWDTLQAGDLPAHTHAESDVTGLVTDLAAAKAGDTFTGAVAVAIDASGDDPFTVSGNNSNLADQTLLKVLNNGELIVAGGAGNGYRFAELMGASNPSGWAGVIKMKNPAGVTAGYILLYSNP